MKALKINAIKIKWKSVIKLFKEYLEGIFLHLRKIHPNW